MRSLHLTAPFADAHRWHQADNAAIARHFAEGPFDILHPQVNWGGPGNASVEMEFPLLPALLATTYRLFGESQAAARLVVISFSLGLIVVVHRLGACLFSVAVGRGAALLVAVSPSAVYFGRIPIVDTLMVFFSATAMLGFVEYFRSRRLWFAAVGGVSLGLAWLVKLPALLVLAPVVFVAWRAGGWAALRDKWFSLPIALAFLATVAWYWHAHNIYSQTGLTVGIWQGAGTYPPALLGLVGPTSTFTGWASTEQLASFEFYERMLARIWTLHLTPPGFVLCLFEIAASWRRTGIGIILVWLLAVAAFIVVVGEGNQRHEYYQLPLLPPAAILCGLAAESVFDGAWVRAHVAPGRLGVLSVAAAVVVASVTAFHFSGVVSRYFRPGGLDLTPVFSGQAIDAHTPPGAVLVVLEHGHSENAANSPMLLYHARRRGWSFDLDSVSVPVITHLRGRGASHFATTLWSQIESERPAVARFLEENTNPVGVSGAPSDFALFSP